MGGDVKGTGIPSLAFTLSMTVRLRGAFSVAQKMSWASKRETTHTEDISYCLLGIKGVHMPLLYGEGANAFLRLQEEIMKVGSDPTIFAWRSDIKYFIKGGPRSLRAPIPEVFGKAGNDFSQNPHAWDAGSGPWSVTSRGVSIEGCPLVETSKAKAILSAATSSPDFVDLIAVPAIALIHCNEGESEGTETTKQLGIALAKQGEIYYHPRWPESLLHLDLNVKEFSRDACIIQMRPGDMI